MFRVPPVEERVKDGKRMDASQHQVEAGHSESFADALKPGTELLHGQFRIEKFLN